MNIKKMFTALSAMVVAVTMTLPSASVFGAEYSQELQDAYNWAHEKGVTTMDTIDNANMYGAITRAEMAKMLSVYATKVLEPAKVADTSKACTFTDIDSVKGDLHEFIIESCQLGIMGQGITAFRPYDTISRAEFGTALSRVLWGNEYEGGTPYYANHLNALKAAGIMNQIANAESTKEIRGWVMLMLMRSEEGGATVDCNEPEYVLACMEPDSEMYKEACPAACREDANEDENGVVKSGDLAVTAKAASDRKVIVSGEGGTEATVSDLDTLTFKTSEEVEVSKVILERYGYSSNDDVVGVWLEDEDGNVISNEGTLNTKGQANLTIKKEYRKVDGTFSATVVLKMKAGTPAGKTIGFKVLDVNCTAKNVDLGNYNPYTYETVVYSGVDVTFTVRGTTKDYNLETGKSYEVSKFKVKAPADSALLIKGYTLTNIAGTKYDKDDDGLYTGDNEYDLSGLKQLDVEKYMDKVVVKVGGKEVKASAKINKDDELVISFDESVELAAKENVEFTVEMSFVEDFDAYDYSIVYAIAKGSHFNAVDAKTQSRVSMPTDEAMVAKSWPTYTIKGGKVKLTNTKLGNVDGAIDSVDVKIAEGNITVGETIKGDLTVNINPNPVPGTIVAMRLKIGDDVDAEGTPDTKGAATKFTFSNVEIEKGGKVELFVDITDKTELSGNKVEGKQYKFTISGWDKFHYTEGKVTDEVDIAGSITPSTLTIQPAKASLTNTLTKDVEFKRNEANRKVVFDGTYTAKKGDLKLNEFLISGNNLPTTSGKATFYLIIDGDEVADAKLVDGNATSTFSDVNIKAGESVKVVVEAEIDAKAWTGTIGKYSLTLKGEDENGNPAGEATKNTTNLKIVEVGAVNVTAGTSKKDILRKASNVTIAEFVVKPSNGASEVDLDQISFTLAGQYDNAGTPTDFTVNEVTLTIDGVTEDATSVGTTFEYAPTVTVGSKGVTVKIELNEEAEGTVSVTNLKVNEKDQTSKEFVKTFYPAVVKISKQEDLKGTTRYTLSVDKEDDVDVRDFKVYYGSTEKGGRNGVFSNSDRFELVAEPSAVLLDKVTYLYSDESGTPLIISGSCSSGALTTESACTGASETWTPEQNLGKYKTVTIEKGVLEDYFKIGTNEEDLKIFKE